MKGIILGSVIGALLVFCWGYLFWNVLPVGNGAVSPVADQAGLQAELAAHIPDTGVYGVPFSQDPADAEFQTLHTKGPIATVYYRAEGSEPMAPSTMVMGYLHQVVVLLVMAIMLKMVAVASYGARFVVVFLGGLAGSGLATLAGPIWWLEPWNHAVIELVYQSVAWLLAALVLATLVKPAGKTGNQSM